MPLSSNGHDVMLNALAVNGTRVQLLKAIKLDADATAGATTVTLDTTVYNGDYISLNNAAGDRETFEVTSLSPTLTPTLDHALVNSYVANDDVGWAPKADTNLLNADAPMETVAWDTTPVSETLTSTGAPEFDVGTNNTIGAFALYNAGETTFYGSFLTNNIESFGAAGTYILTAASVTLES